MPAGRFGRSNLPAKSQAAAHFGHCHLSKDKRQSGDSTVRLLLQGLVAAIRAALHGIDIMHEGNVEATRN
jgi:hypothetical protein